MQAVFEVYPGLQTGLSEDTAEAYRLRDCILSAAAKMVRETGAVEALEDLLMHGSPVPSGPRGEPVPHQANPGEAEAALARLRRIAEREGRA